MVQLRSMRGDDLSRVGRWLRVPHVARWFLAGSSAEDELEDIARSIAGEQDTSMLMVLEEGKPIGWCQWYPCMVDPEWARDLGAGPDDVGIDYAIGDPARLGRGVGTQLVAALVDAVRAAHPGCDIVSDPDARNLASRRVLEKNGFTLERVAPIPSEPTLDPMAVYRLAARTPLPTTTV
jgi:aminoglycoside 6'-N-acetyltransferase